MSESGSSESVTPTEPLSSMHQDKTGHQSTMFSGCQQLRNLSGRQGNTINGVGAHFVPKRECTELEQTESRTQEGPLPSLYQNEACEHMSSEQCSAITESVGKTAKHNGRSRAGSSYASERIHERQWRTPYLPFVYAKL